MNLYPYRSRFYNVILFKYNKAHNVALEFIKKYYIYSIEESDNFYIVKIYFETLRSLKVFLRDTGLTKNYIIGV